MYIKQSMKSYIPYVSFTNNKISKYSKRRLAQFFTVERALSNEYIHFAK